jgi:hypothetical protein
VLLSAKTLLTKNGFVGFNGIAGKNEVAEKNCQRYRNGIVPLAT